MKCVVEKIIERGVYQACRHTDGKRGDYEQDKFTRQIAKAVMEGCGRQRSWWFLYFVRRDELF